MCSVDVPEPKTVEVDKPVFARNPALDGVENDARTANAMRRGRSSLVIPLGQTGDLGFAGRNDSANRSAGFTSGTAPVGGSGIGDPRRIRPNARQPRVINPRGGVGGNSRGGSGGPGGDNNGRSRFARRG